MERSSWRCVPSPQSNSSRSPPRRISVAGRPRRAVGAEPAVPRKSTSRSMWAYLRGSPGRSVERYVLELDPAAADARDAHRVPRRAALIGRAARIEDVEAVALLVERDVRVAEDHEIRVREARAHALE